MTRTRGMLGAMVTIGAVQILIIAVNLIRSKLLAVLLGPAGVGVLSVIDQLVQLVSYVSAFSIPLATGKLLSHAHDEGFDAFRRGYGNLLRLLVTLTSFGTAVALIIVTLRPTLLGVQLLPYQLILLPALLRIPIISLHGYFTHVLAAAQRWREATVLLLCIAVSLAFSTPIGVRMGGLTGLYWGNLIAETMIVGGVFVYLRARLNLPLRDRTTNIFRELRKNRILISFGPVLHVTSIMYLCAQFIARYATLARYGEAEAGLLYAAITLANSLGLVLNNAVLLYLTPILNRKIPKETKLQAATEYQRNLIVLLGIMGMPLILFSSLLLNLLFSPSFVVVAPVVFLFVLAQGLMQLAAVYQSLLIGLDDLKTYGIILGAGHLSLATLAWLLAFPYGLRGVGFAYFGASGLIFASMLLVLVVRHGQQLPRRMLLLVGYVLLSMMVAGFVPVHQASLGPIIFGAKVIYYVLFSCSLMLFLDRADHQRLLRQLLLRLDRGERWRQSPVGGRIYRHLDGITPTARGERPAMSSPAE